MKKQKRKHHDKKSKAFVILKDKSKYIRPQPPIPVKENEDENPPLESEGDGTEGSE